MDFLRILKSLEEFLFELISWVVFFPITLWRIVRSPSGMAEYAEREIEDKVEDQFSEAISPPLMLMIALVIAHAIEVAGHASLLKPTGALSRAVVGTEQNLILFRSLIYSVWPLLFACTYLRRKHRPLQRETLKRPFYAQCYLAAPFAIAFSGGSALARMATPAAQFSGAVVMLAAGVWYVAVETLWMRKALETSILAAFSLCMVAFLLGLAIIAVIGVALVG